MKGLLPKAYLRIDPNLDQHPDALGMLRLICAANRQHPRGHFQRETAVGILGRKRFLEFTTARPGKTRPDLTPLPDGRLYLDGWEHWQEGDFTVGERVRRLREKRSVGVTPPLPEPLPKPLPPSEALGSTEGSTEGTENERSLVNSENPSNGHAPLTEAERKEYAEAVWQAFLERSGQAATRIMSPAEFDVVKSWMDAGIPLRVVLRGMEDTKGKGGTLVYFRPSVRDAYDYHLKAMA